MEIPIHADADAACSEFRVEYLNPPYMTMKRPQISNVPKKIAFNSKFHVNVAIPTGLGNGDLKGTRIPNLAWILRTQLPTVALMDLGFSSHAFHSSSRLVFMEAEFSQDGKTLSITSPPNNRVFPPGPGKLDIHLSIEPMLY